MKTLKKILVMCMTLVVMVGVTGCVDSDKQDQGVGLDRAAKVNFIWIQSKSDKQI